MPVEFLTDDEAAAFGRYTGPLSRADLERVFFLGDQDRALVAQRRGQHMKLGFAHNSRRNRRASGSRPVSKSLVTVTVNLLQVVDRIPLTQTI